MERTRLEIQIDLDEAIAEREKIRECEHEKTKLIKSLRKELQDVKRARSPKNWIIERWHKILTLRIKYGLTQRETALQLNIHSSYLRVIEEKALEYLGIPSYVYNQEGVYYTQGTIIKELRKAVLAGVKLRIGVDA